MLARKVAVGLLLALTSVCFFFLLRGKATNRLDEQATAEIAASARPELGSSPGIAGTVARQSTAIDQVRHASPISIREHLMASNDWKDLLGRMDSLTSIPIGERLFYKALILDSCSHYQDAVKFESDSGALTKNRFELSAYIMGLISDSRQKAAMAYNLERKVANVCRGFANSPISRDMAEKAFAEAAAAGDLKAQARMIEQRLVASAARNAASLPSEYQQYAASDRAVGFPDPITPSERNQLLGALLSGDPIAIRVAGNILSLGSDKQSLRFGPEQIDLGIHAEETWTLVACQFGFECGTRNMAVNLGCAEQKQCSDDYASYLQEFVLKPSEFATVQANAMAIANAIRRGDQSAFQLVAQAGYNRTFVMGAAPITIR
jgi:hypothetical protein